MKRLFLLLVAIGLFLTASGCKKAPPVAEGRPQESAVQSTEESSLSSESSSEQSSQSSVNLPSGSSAPQSSSSQSSSSPPAPTPKPEPEPIEDPVTVEDLYGIYQCYGVIHPEYNDLDFLEWTITADTLEDRGISYVLFDKACEDGWCLEEGETKEDAWSRLQINQKGLIYQGVRYVMSGAGGSIAPIVSMTATSMQCEYYDGIKTFTFTYNKQNKTLTVLENGCTFTKVY